MSESSQPPRPSSGFKRSSDADTNPIPVQAIQAQLAQEEQQALVSADTDEVTVAENIPVAEDVTVVEDLAPAAEESEAHSGPMTAGTRVIDLPPPVPSDPMTQGTQVIELPSQPILPDPIAEGTVVLPLPAQPPHPPPAPPPPPPRPLPRPPARPDPRLNPPAPPPMATPFTRGAIPGRPDTAPPPSGFGDPRMPSPTDLGLVRRVRPLPQSGWRKPSSNARLSEPYLGFRLDLDPALVAELVMKMGPSAAVRVPTRRGLFLSAVTDGIRDAAIRLMQLLDHPEDVPTLAALSVSTDL